MGCLLWVWTQVYVLNKSLHLCMGFHVILNCVIMAHDYDISCNTGQRWNLNWILSSQDTPHISLSPPVGLYCWYFGKYCWYNDVALNSLFHMTPWRRFADDIFKCIFLNENEWIFPRISLKFVPKVLFNNIPALVWIKSWRQPGDKPLSEPMMIS